MDGHRFPFRAGRGRRKIAMAAGPELDISGAIFYCALLRELIGKTA
jgi:hypothetical protein